MPQGVVWGVSCLSVHLLPQVSGMFFGGRPATVLASQLTYVRASFLGSYSSFGAQDHSLTFHSILLLLESC